MDATVSSILANWITAAAAAATAVATIVTAFFVWRQSRFEAPLIGTYFYWNNPCPEALVLRVWVGGDDDKRKYFIKNIAVRSPRNARLAKVAKEGADGYGGPKLEKGDEPWVKNIDTDTGLCRSDIYVFVDLDRKSVV